MTPRLLPLDPGRQGFGWALYHGNRFGMLGVVPQPKPARQYEQTPLVEVAQHAYETIRQAIGPGPVRCVVERMCVYPPVRKAADRRDPTAELVAKANDLLDLQAIGALVAGWFGGAVEYRFPRQWKGTTDTAAIAARLKGWKGWQDGELAQYLAYLNAVPKGLQHNGVDAAAIGLVSLGRIRLT